MKEKIVILGATEYVNPLIIKAKDMGFQTHVFAWKTGDIGETTADVFYPISIKNTLEILEVCKKIQPSGVISIGSDLAAVTAAYLSEQLGLVGNSFVVVERVTNKLKFRELLVRHHFLQPGFVGIGDNYSEKNNKNVSFPVVVKPTDRSASRGVKKILTRNELVRGVVEAREISYEGKVIVEEYIFGRHFSAECISENGEHTVVSFTKRDNLENHNGFIEHLYKSPASLTELQEQKIKEAVNTLLTILELENGASSVEFLIGPNEEVVFLEVTPSMYGDFIATDLVPASVGYDYMEAAINISCGRSVDKHIDYEKKRNVKLQIIVSKQDYRDLNQISEIHPEAIIEKKLFVPEEEIPEAVDGGRYGYFIYYSS